MNLQIRLHPLRGAIDSDKYCRRFF